VPFGDDGDRELAVAVRHGGGVARACFDLPLGSGPDDRDELQLADPVGIRRALQQLNGQLARGEKNREYRDSAESLRMAVCNLSRSSVRIARTVARLPSRSCTATGRKSLGGGPLTAGDMARRMVGRHVACELPLLADLRLPGASGM